MRWDPLPGAYRSSRSFGLLLDNMISADVVLATGEVVRASQHNHPDLFWVGSHCVAGSNHTRGTSSRLCGSLHPRPSEELARHLV
jgi:FAD/FMN-containing dehydrogenase